MWWEKVWELRGSDFPYCLRRTTDRTPWYPSLETCQIGTMYLISVLPVKQQQQKSSETEQLQKYILELHTHWKIKCKYLLLVLMSWNYKNKTTFKGKKIAVVPVQKRFDLIKTFLLILCGFWHGNIQNWQVSVESLNFDEMTPFEIKICCWKFFASSAQKLVLCFWLFYRHLENL